MNTYNRNFGQLYSKYNKSLRTLTCRNDQNFGVYPLSPL